MSSNMNNMYSAIITTMVQKMKSQLEEIETMTRIMDRMNRENACCPAPCNNDNEIDLNILMHRFAILERRLAAVEESKNIYVSQNEDDAWLGECGPVENEVIELSSAEEEATPVVVKKANEDVAAEEAKRKADAAAAEAEAEAEVKAKAKAKADAKKKAEEEVAAAVIAAAAEAKKKAEEEAAIAMAAAEAKRKAEEAEAKKKAKEEALAKKRAEEEAARKKAEEEEEEEEEEVEEEEEEEEEEDATELTEFEYKGQTYYRDEDNVVYVLSDEGEPEPVGRFNEKTGGVKMFAK